MPLLNLPLELRQLPNWVCADKAKFPIDPKTGKMAIVTDPTTWSSFDEAVAYAQAYSLYIGFVLSQEAGYSIIDLDNKPEKPCTEEQLQRHQKILQVANSYTELSVSGTGYHIILKGSVPAGCRRDNVEVYSDSRYMICTGNHFPGYPVAIAANQPLLDTLFLEMGSASKKQHLEDTLDILSDVDLVTLAMNALNADKFNSLCSGDLSGYPSQSEADLALLSMLAFYSQSNEQCRRLFRMSQLGKRDKATKNDTYINYALGRIRANQPPPVDFDALIENAKPKVAEVVAEEPEPAVQAVPLALPAASTLTRPPGLVGDLADYFYSTATRPVYEIALAAAIGVTAGVCGRSYNVSGTGLNQYIVLLAGTGTGKDAISSGIEKLFSAVQTKVPMVRDFRGPSVFASGQAMIKTLAKKPCFVSVLGEFGLTLQQLSDKRATSAEKMMRLVLLDVYGKSGWTGTLEPMVYSDAEKNTTSINAPNITVIGESTQTAFFEGLDEGHITCGLIPRFLIIEYKGERPRRNKEAGALPTEGLTQRFADLTANALAASLNQGAIGVTYDSLGLTTLDAFDIYCDDQHRLQSSEVYKELWNRAHLKAIKLAALIAVGVNYVSPVITKELATWAIDFVLMDVTGIMGHFESGNVGDGDSKQDHDIIRGIRGYLDNPPAWIKKDPILKNLSKDKLIPYLYVQRQTVNLASFKGDRAGAKGALKKCIQGLVDSGALVEISKQAIHDKYGFSGLVYGVSATWR